MGQEMPGESGTQTSDPKDDAKYRLIGLLEMRGKNTVEATRAGESGLHNGPQYLKQQGTEQGRVPPATPARGKGQRHHC